MNNDSAIITNETCTSTSTEQQQQQQKNEINIITLGDGDYTWSLDFGRYLLSTTTLSKLEHYGDGGEGTNNLIRLIVTGIDSLNEFQQKYRNYNYTLRELEKLNTKSKLHNDPRLLQVEIRHEVNAIIHSSSSSLSSSSSSSSTLYSTDLQRRGHFIIFHHPHLGTEDAQLHSQFLCHLFHSINHYWMIPSSSSSVRNGEGVFYLTLVNGQYERWKCCDAAQRHGMKLLQQYIFVPNPQSNLFVKSMYGHRRHQTGKSFASRTTGSTTYTFVRTSYDTTTTTTTTTHNSNSLNLLQLPWFHLYDKISDDNAKVCPVTTFMCSLCDKQFREERSLKNHIISVHDNQNKRKRVEHDNDGAKFVCNQCNESRSFDTSEALNDHILAKHNGIHSKIVPDWVKQPKSTSLNLSKDEDQKLTMTLFGTCTICDAVFQSANDETEHYQSFIPSLVDNTTMISATMTKCRFCQKSFQQVRAQQQHENFCSARPRDNSIE